MYKYSYICTNCETKKKKFIVFFFNFIFVHYTKKGASLQQKMDKMEFGCGSADINIITPSITLNINTTTGGKLNIKLKKSFFDNNF